MNRRTPTLLDPFTLSLRNAITIDSSSGAPRLLPERTTRGRQGPDQKNLSEDALFLLSVRREIGMTQADFALALGETKERLVNIENARVKKIAPELLVLAKKLRDEEHSVRADPLASLKKLTMNQVIDRWREMTKATDDDECAVLLGASQTTMRRWRAESNRPAVNDLLRYETIARRICERSEQNALPNAIS